MILSIRICDLEPNGTQVTGAEPVTLAYDGDELELDVCPAHMGALRTALEPYMTHGRRVSSSRGAGNKPSKRTPASRDRSRAIRQWASENNITVNGRGRIPGEVESAYDAAH